MIKEKVWRSDIILHSLGGIDVIRVFKSGRGKQERESEEGVSLEERHGEIQVCGLKMEPRRMSKAKQVASRGWKRQGDGTESPLVPPEGRKS